MPRLTDLTELPHHEARCRVRSAPIVFVPVNPVEYHGPHLSLHNDALVTRGLISGLADALGLTEALCTSDLEIGVDPCPGPGTRYTPLSLALPTVREACRALKELDVRAIALVTFHGAPLHAHLLDSVAAELTAEGIPAVAPLAAVLESLLALASCADAGAGVERYRESVKHLDDTTAAQVLERLPTDFHAGFFETSVALHLAPHSVSRRVAELSECPPFELGRELKQACRLLEGLGQTDLARELRFAGLGAAWYALRPFPGYTSFPALASAASGAFFVEELVRLQAERIRNVCMAGQTPPKTVLSWLPPISLGGRLPSHNVHLKDMLPAPTGWETSDRES